MARHKRETNGPKYYTTFQVSKFFGVSLPTVVNWVNSGLLDAHRTPGGHRRIAHDSLVAFARAQNYPLPADVAGDQGTRVLVVDDDEDFTRMVQRFLTEVGQLKVDVANSGFAAGLTVARFKPDLVLLDLMMPDVDGFEVFRTLRDDAKTRHIPVVACTAFRDASVDARVAEERFDGLIEKPIKLEALLEAIRSHLVARATKG